MKKTIFCGIICLLLSTIAKADNWMAQLDDATPLCQVSIPGTHDAGTGNGFTTEWAEYGKQFGQTQECSIAEQWASGIRAFDLRPAIIKRDGKNHLQIFHGVLQTKASFEETIRLLISNVTLAPSEFAVVVFRHETDGDKNNPEWAATMKAFLNSPDIKPYIVNYRPSLTVKDMRGKILVLARKHYDDTPVGGYIENWSSEEGINDQVGATIWSTEGRGCLFVQDYYETKGRHMQTKLSCMGRMIRTPEVGNVLRINHASAYTQEAMLGNESFATSDGYRDNAAHTNKFASRLLRQHKSVGIIMMDYAGVNKSGGYKVRGLELTQAIIQQNFK